MAYSQMDSMPISLRTWKIPNPTIIPTIVQKLAHFIHFLNQILIQVEEIDANEELMQESTAVTGTFLEECLNLSQKILKEMDEKNGQMDGKEEGKCFGWRFSKINKLF